MQSRIHNFAFDANYNFGTENVFVQQYSFPGFVLPPSGSFIITENDDFIITETGDMLVTE